METLLVLMHTDDESRLPRPALEALGAGLELAAALGAAPPAVGVFGRGAAAAVRALDGCGAARALVVEDELFDRPRYATDVAAAGALARAAAATLIVTPGTSRMARIAAGLAHRLGGRVDTHAVAIDAAEGAPYVSRWFYRQRMLGRLTRAQRPWVIVLDPGCRAPWAPDPTAAGAALNPEPVDAAFERTPRTVVSGVQSPPAAQQTIRPDAELLFVAGAGWTKKQSDGRIRADEAATLIREFLDVTQASLGSSKSLVDQGAEGQPVLPFLSHLNQVGQTGSTPRHPKGLATCCHGEEPHVVGWRFINERRAVNLDANCGWAHGKADVLYVADAFEVMACVNALLKGG